MLCTLCCFFQTTHGKYLYESSVHPAQFSLLSRRRRRLHICVLAFRRTYMTPGSTPSDACLAAEFVTLLALPSVAFSRPVIAVTLTLASRTSHPDTSATNCINAGTVYLSRNGYRGATQKRMSPSNSTRKTTHIDLFSSPYD